MNIIFNMHYIHSKTGKVTTISGSEERYEYYTRIFFRDKDYLIWNKIYEWTRSDAKGAIDFAITKFKNRGELNNAVKLCMLRYANKH